MKRCWFGLGLLVVLLGLGLFFSHRMTAGQEKLADTVQFAQEAAVQEDWDRASMLLGSARREWERGWHFTAAFADHEPMEEIDSLFAQGQVYLANREGAELAAICAQLARSLRAVGDAHGLTWWNLL